MCADECAVLLPHSASIKAMMHKIAVTVGSVGVLVMGVRSKGDGVKGASVGVRLLGDGVVGAGVVRANSA